MFSDKAISFIPTQHKETITRIQSLMLKPFLCPASFLLALDRVISAHSRVWRSWDGGRRISD